MKKRLIGLTAWTILLVLLTSAAWAEWKNGYYYEDGKKFDDFRDRKSVTIPETVTVINRDALKNLSRDFVLKVTEGSYAEQFAKEYGYQYDNGKKKVVGYTIDDVQEKADWIIANYVEDNYKGEELTDLEKVTVLHDWLTTNATYDYYGLDNNLTNMFGTDAVLLNGKGVCNSYAQAYSLLLSKVGVENKYLAGDTLERKKGNDVPNHAWSLVLVDGQWSWVDSTWDDGSPYDSRAENPHVTAGTEGRNLFMISDAKMRDASSDSKKDRIWDEAISADHNMVGFVNSLEGTVYYGEDSDWATRYTGWLEYRHAYGFGDGYFMYYDPITDTRSYRQEGNYYFDEDGMMAIGWEKISSGWYYFDESGLMKTGWVYDDGEKYHMADDGRMETGMTDIWDMYAYYDYNLDDWVSGYVTFIFGNDGKLLTGWSSLDGKRYYSEYDGRVQKNTWVTVDDERYHLAEDGSMETGYIDLWEANVSYNWDKQEWEPGYARYYLGDDGVMRTAWQKLNGKTYYFGDNGRMARDSWVEVDEKNYHMNTDGALDTGWKDIYERFGTYNWSTNQWEPAFVRYYLGDDGVRREFWQTLEGKTYYFGDDGRMRRGGIQWAVKDGENRTFNFDNDGVLTHIPVTDQAVKATRKTTGLTEGSHCNVCGEVLEEQEVTPTIIPGDADSNREIDGRDAIRMMKKLRESGTECDEDAGDVDQNGRMNEKDVQIMMQYLGGDNVVLQ